MEKIPLLYALHSGMLYGTERMALYTIHGLADQFNATVFAPPGPLHQECQRLGISAMRFSGAKEFSRALRPFLSNNKQLAFIATGVMHSLVCLGWNALYQRRISHLHLVHGGAEERLSYGRKRLLNHTPVRFVAVSQYVRERLVANGVRRGQITVIENFMPDVAVHSFPRRKPFAQSGIQRIAVVSRCDPEKRLDLLFDAMERYPQLHKMRVHIYSTGHQLEAFRSRAERSGVPIVMEGFRTDVAQQLALSDLLIHTCPVEPFGLAILEAMAAHVPVLTPDAGGAGSLIQPEVSGFHFAANNPDDLAAKISYIDSLPAERLNQITSNADGLFQTRFSEKDRIGDYRDLLLHLLA
jgi:glycosyltransferase involved in cell wall biosynthesis